MNFKRWRMGLLVACLAGMFGAVTTLGIVKDIGGWQQFALILAIGIAKDGLLFLTKHPVETIVTDTDLIRKALAAEAAKKQ
jgi:hypothetical protein